MRIQQILIRSNHLSHHIKIHLSTSSRHHRGRPQRETGRQNQRPPPRHKRSFDFMTYSQNLENLNLYAMLRTSTHLRPYDMHRHTVYPSPTARGYESNT